MEQKRTYDVKELQQVLGIGRSKAYELVNAKGFPSFRIGRKVLINAAELELWMKKGGEKSEDQ